MILELTPSAAAFMFGTAGFAATGVLAAARQDMDALSVIVIGVVTALGGGTLRDLILDVPVFWLHQPLYLYVPVLASLGTFFFERWLRSTERSLLYRHFARRPLQEPATAAPSTFAPALVLVCTPTGPGPWSSWTTGSSSTRWATSCSTSSTTNGRSRA